MAGGGAVRGTRGVTTPDGNSAVFARESTIASRARIATANRGCSELRWLLGRDAQSLLQERPETEIVLHCDRQIRLDGPVYRGTGDRALELIAARTFECRRK